MSHFFATLLFVVIPAAGFCLGQGLRKPRDFWEEFGD